MWTLHIVMGRFHRTLIPAKILLLVCYHKYFLTILILLLRNLKLFSQSQESEHVQIFEYMLTNIAYKIGFKI